MSAPHIPDRCGTCAYFHVVIVDPPGPVDPLLTDAGRYICDAFPVWPWIPVDISLGDFDHSQPHDGDHGLRYKAR
jgi:hypothetical protein